MAKVYNEANLWSFFHRHILHIGNDSGLGLMTQNKTVKCGRMGCERSGQGGVVVLI